MALSSNTLFLLINTVDVQLRSISKHVNPSLDISGQPLVIELSTGELKVE